MNNVAFTSESSFYIHFLEISRWDLKEENSIVVKEKYNKSESMRNKLENEKSVRNFFEGNMDIKIYSILENNDDEILKRYIQKWQLPEIMISSINHLNEILY